MYHTEHINPIGRLCASCFHVISYHNCCVKSTDLRQKYIFSFPFLRHFLEFSIEKNEFIYYFTFDLCRFLFDYVIFCRISYNCYIYCQLLEEGKTSRIKTRKDNRKKMHCRVNKSYTAVRICYFSMIFTFAGRTPAVS